MSTITQTDSTNMSTLLSSLSTTSVSSTSSAFSSATTSGLNGMASFIYGSNTSSTSTQASTYAVDVKQDAASLKATVAKLTQKGDNSVFNTVTADSDSKSVSADYSGTDTFDEFTVGVSQLAQAQKNEGTALKSSAVSTMDSSSFTVTDSEGKTKSFFVSVGSKDTNEDVQNKVADKINNSKLGVTATVSTDSKTGTSQLVITGNKTGEGENFSVSGELAEKLGINVAAQSAQDSAYTINGENYTSDSNKISVTEDLTLTLNSTTESDATVSYSANNKTAINSVRELVNNYNALLDTANNFSDSGAEKLASQLTGAADTYEAALSRIGISTNDKGYLVIDSDKMQSAADSGELENFLSSNSEDNANYGFLNRLDTIAQRADDPTNYMSSSSQSSVNNSSTSNYVTSFAKSNYYINSYVNLSSTSMLFDAFF